MYTSVIKRIIVAIIIIFLGFNTLYSFDYKSWIWEFGSVWQKVIGVSVSLSALLGVLSVIAFSNHKKIGYPLGIVNALLFSLFAFSFKIPLDAFINLFIYIPILIFTYFKTTRIIKNNKNFEFFRSNIYSTSFFVFLTILMTVLFYYVTPLLHEKILILLNQFDKTQIYGSNFNYYQAAIILNSLINALSIIALSMMLLGFRDSWPVWIFKNILSFIFFGGVGFLNWTTMIINIIYMLFSIYFYLVTTNKQNVKIAFISTSASGKEVLIDKLNPYFNYNKFTKFEDFNANSEEYVDYINDLKTNGYKFQRGIFKRRLKQIKKMQFNAINVMDGHMIEDFIYPEVNIKLNNFSNKEKWYWKFWKMKYIISLALQEKLDYVFVITKDFKTTNVNRLYGVENASSKLEKNRWSAEINNTHFFKEVDSLYLKDNNLSPYLSHLVKKYSKNVVHIHNTNADVASGIVINKIDALINKKTSSNIRKILTNLKKVLKFK
ncbi:nicotinamide mononucleotide transporter family protein [Mycoplasma sp. OR1901]|uniref:nicotinamide mononucleotide transporter family protein n=1 Tax=Mycoplasma sp. OR1901 TaxID=2742195 RepID=UPI001582EC5A|nr:nicotinamide mononucleotide transporter family protein [Mycoplasma sp. OR1901]QKT05578.1 nicotinamide mononucleotide transporter [Mycoplasma sp. OR1901]